MNAMNMNSGYVGWSMSNRAAEAYDKGLAPLSKIRGGAWKKIAATVVQPAEWHHTSKFCNRTDFYDPRAIAGAIRALKKLGRTPADADATRLMLRDFRFAQRHHSPRPTGRDFARSQALYLMRRARADEQRLREIELDYGHFDERYARDIAIALTEAHVFALRALGRPDPTWYHP